MFRPIVSSFSFPLSFLYRVEIFLNVECLSFSKRVLKTAHSSELFLSYLRSFSLNLKLKDVLFRIPAEMISLCVPDDNLPLEGGLSSATKILSFLSYFSRFSLIILLIISIFNLSIISFSLPVIIFLTFICLGEEIAECIRPLFIFCLAQSWSSRLSDYNKENGVAASLRKCFHMTTRSLYLARVQSLFSFFIKFIFFALIFYCFSMANLKNDLAYSLLGLFFSAFGSLFTKILCDRFRSLISFEKTMAVLKRDFGTSLPKEEYLLPVLINIQNKTESIEADFATCKDLLAKLSKGSQYHLNLLKELHAITQKSFEKSSQIHPKSEADLMTKQLIWRIDVRQVVGEIFRLTSAMSRLVDRIERKKKLFEEKFEIFGEVSSSSLSIKEVLEEVREMKDQLQRLKNEHHAVLHRASYLG